ncbi:bifunctional DNA primase/polymerase [Streptomyces sp. NPDC017993]|uniref:bifunctional DNA primase/polymerase n=1 Tax=Streptomyces sp. NPDC017993 TaxID=3365027 RepID=UPI0037A6AD45
MATPRRHTEPPPSRPRRPHPAADTAPHPEEAPEGPPQSPGSSPLLITPADAHSAALAHALNAAARGYAVIPLTRTKLPAVRSPHRGHPESPPCRGGCGRPGHGVHDATADPLGIRRLFAAAPWATGYGIACGRPPHHLIGIDLDTKNGADSLTALRFIAEAHRFPLPPTVTVLTPSGGRHLWLTGPPSPPAPRVPNSVGRLAPGIDIRGAGGYLVGPGSVTVHGRYALAPGSPDRPAPAPRALLALLTPPARPDAPPAVPPQPAGALVRFVRSSPPGQRNARLFWAACRAHECGLGPELSARLLAAARHTGLCEQEARATLASAARR